MRGGGGLARNRVPLEHYTHEARAMLILSLVLKLVKTMITTRKKLQK